MGKGTLHAEYPNQHCRGVAISENQITEKICHKCGTEKPISEFSKNKKSKDGISSQCKNCFHDYYLLKKKDYQKRSKEYYENKLEKIKERREERKDEIKEKAARYRMENIESYKKKDKEYHEKNKEKRNAKCKEYYQKNKKRRNMENKKWRNENKDITREYKNNYEKERKKIDIDYMLRRKLRIRIYGAIKKQRTDKAYSSIKLLGCTPKEARMHLEKQFKEGMSWENCGKGGWEIDHIRPCASFDLTDPEQQKKCFHYTNLQPLWVHENRIKSDKII